MNECVFCRIARGEIRSEIFYKDPQVIGLMDICPIRPGHAQLIPREHYDISKTFCLIRPDAYVMLRGTPADADSAAEFCRRVFSPASV